MTGFKGPLFRFPPLLLLLLLPLPLPLPGRDSMEVFVLPEPNLSAEAAGRLDRDAEARVSGCVLAAVPADEACRPLGAAKNA
jgi:hypothetical protein